MTIGIIYSTKPTYKAFVSSDSTWYYTTNKQDYYIRNVAIAGNYQPEHGYYNVAPAILGFWS